MQINFTEKPMFLVGELELVRSVKLNISLVSKYIDGVFGFKSATYESINSGMEMRNYVFKKFFVLSPSKDKRKYDSGWVLDVYEFVLHGDIKASEDLMEKILGEDVINYRPNTQVCLRRALWLLLILLFKDRCILLPPLLRATQFKHNSEVVREFGYELYPELMGFTVSARLKLDLPPYWVGVDKKVRERVAQYGPRLFWLIGTVTPEDMTIEALVSVHKKYYYEGERLTAELPVHTIMSHVCAYFTSRVRFTYDELFGALNKLRGTKYKTRGLGELNSVELPQLIANASTDEELVDYCRLLRRTNFAPSNLNDDLSGCLDGKHAPTLKRWHALQQAYLVVKKYEDESNGSVGLSFLNIYLFVYLSRWFDAFGDKSTFGFPRYVSELGLELQAPITREPNSPMPLCQFVDALAGDAPSTRYMAMQQLRAMFQWLELKCPSDDSGRFKNFITSIDMPASGGLPQSDKRPFSPLEYSLGVNYLFCIFRALELLNADILSNSYENIMHGSLEERARSLGWNPIFYYGKRKYEVSILPRIFFRRWSIPLTSGCVTTIFSPHLIVHTLVALESGLRHQSVQWLSIDFDKYVIGELSMNKPYWLHVVVDKVSKKPLKTIVSAQTMIALRYQRTIRGLVSCDSFKKEKSYENRVDNSRPDYIPLFSFSLLSGDPYSDAVYSKAYTKFLVGYQSFLGEHSYAARFYEFKPYGYEYGESVISGAVEVRSVEYPYCPVRIVTDMTPHHTRNSTVKVWRRILPDAKVGLFKTGQGAATVRYYDALLQQDYDEVLDELEGSVQKIWAGTRLDTTTPQSNFRSALEKNTSQALRDFNCITMSHVGSAEKDSGLQDLLNKYQNKISHHSTHICTRGDKCTIEIIEAGLEKRCGLCVYSVKGVDHIPAIEVKIHTLSLEVEDLHAYADTIPVEHGYELERIDERLDACISDLMGWTWCRDYLLECYKRDAAALDRYISFKPDLLKRKMVELSMDESSLKYVFSKLYEVSLYPELQTDVSRAKYNYVKMRLKGGVTNILDIFKAIPCDPAMEVVSQIKSILKASDMRIDDFLKVLETSPDLSLENYKPLLLGSEG